MQLKKLDQKLPKLFEYETYDALNAAIERHIQKTFIENTEDARNYYRHRWFIYKCSEADEYLFKILPSVVNDGSNDPNRDFTIRNKVSLDLKGTVLLKQYKDDPEYVYKNPLALIDSYYKEQSQDFHYRRRLQNRLFVVHHSYVAPERESYVRTLFDVKSVIFKRYVDMMLQSDHKIFDYMNGRKADLIMLVETADGRIAYGFASENLKGEMIMRVFNKDTVQ